MSKILKPRRGTTSTMNNSKSNILLSTGEMFLEVPSNGINTGNGDCRIKVGDGTSSYDDLSYSIGGPNMTFRDNEIIQTSGTNISSTTTSSSSTISTITNASNNDLSYVTSGYSLSQIIGSIKSAITRTNQGLTKLNSSITDVSDSKSNLLVVTTASSNTITIVTSDTQWNISETKNGYTPLMWNFYNAYSSQILLGVEQLSLTSGSFSISGYARSVTSSISARLSARILWVKNS